MNGNWGISRYKQGLLREEVNSRINFNFTDLVIKILCAKRQGEANHHRENEVQILIYTETAAVISTVRIFHRYMSFEDFRR